MGGQKRMERSVAELTIGVVGPLTVVGADGVDYVPRGRKAKGLLALLAMAPSHQRSRAWLQDKLWSDRGQEQGADSLRQTLAEVRRAFRGYKNCLKADRFNVALDTSRVAIDRGADSRVESADETILFEDVDVPDPEFENWLREQRNHFKPTGTKSGVQDNGTPPGTVDLNPRLQLVISQGGHHDLGSRERIIADGLTDIIARSVSELSSVDIIDLRKAANGASSSQPLPQGNALQVHADIAADAAGVTCRFALTSTADNRLLWTTGVHSRTGALQINDPAILRDLNQLVEEVSRHFLASTGPQTQERRIASLLCQRGIQLLFRLQKDDIMIADRLFEQAFAIEGRGIYLAWRAYLRTFLLVEFIPDDRQTIAEEAIAFMRMALELEPNNSYVASFSAQVHSIVRQSYVAAFEFAERSVQLNPANPIGWACLGIAECNLGKGDAGFQHTLHARELAGSTPFRFFVNAFACIVGSMIGEIDKAILLGEASHGLSPTFKPPMRFLSVLYLLRDQHEQSQAMVDKLKLTEPNFSYDLLRDRSYPASSLHHSRLLDKLPQRQI